MKKAEKRGGSSTPPRSNTKTEFVDPLSLSDPLFQAMDGSDPLSRLAAEKDTLPKSGRSASFEVYKEHILIYLKILHKLTKYLGIFCSISNLCY